MATCLDIVTYAMRLSRILPMGDEPTSDEGAAGLAALQSLYDQWRTSGMFGELEDVYLDGDDVAEEGVRYFVPTGYTLAAPTSVYIDFDGFTRQPRDLALYEALTEAGVQTVGLYDRTAWVSLLGLALTDTAPLSSRNAMGLAASLAISGAFISMFGGEPGPDVRGLARQFTAALMDKGGSTHERATPDYY
jgi:hypothetical protein